MSPPAALAVPELAFVLLAAAALAVALETAVPGVGLGALGALGLLGVAAWLLAGMSPHALGLVATLLAAALFVAGLFLRGRALWSAAGALALLVAGATLFDEPVAAAVLLPTAAAAGVGAAVLGRLVQRVWSSPPFRGTAGTLVGLVGEVREGAAAGDKLRVHVAGTLWTARAHEALRAGDRIVVTAQDDMELRVAGHPRGEEAGHDGQD